MSPPQSERSTQGEAVHSSLENMILAPEFSRRRMLGNKCLLSKTYFEMVNFEGTDKNSTCDLINTANGSMCVIC